MISRRITYENLNLGYRIKKIIKSFDNDNWFDSKNIVKNTDQNFHEKAYKLSLNKLVGGSENISI